MNQATAQAEMATQPDRHSPLEHLWALMFGGPMCELRPIPKTMVNAGAVDLLVTFKDGSATQQSFEGTSGYFGTVSARRHALTFTDGKSTIIGYGGKIYPRHEVAHYQIINEREHWIEASERDCW